MVKNAFDQVHKMSEYSLKLEEDRLERIFQSSELSLLQLSADPLISNSFLDGNAADKPLIHLEIMKLIQSAQNTNDFAGNIILYNNASEDILDYRHGFVPKKLEGTISYMLDRLMQSGPKNRCLYIAEANGFLGCVRYLSAANSDQARGLLIVQLDNEFIQKYLEEPSLYSTNQSVMILDSSNRLLTHIGKYFADEQTDSNERAVQRIISSSETKGSLMMTDSTGERFYYTYLKTELGRTYIAKIAESEILHNIIWIRYFISLSILLFISIGILLTVVTGLKTYNPIRKLIDFGRTISGKQAAQAHAQNEISFIQDCWTRLNEESRKNDAYIKKWEPTVRDSMLLQLLEREANRQDDLVDPNLASSLAERDSFVVMAIRSEHVYRENRFHKGDGPIVSFIVKNMFNEILMQQKQLNGYVVIDRNGLGVGVLSLNRTAPEEDVQSLLRSFAGQLRDAFQQYVRLEVGIGVGGIYGSFQDIYRSYRQALEALQSRIYKEHGPILFFQDMESPKKSAAFHYPMAIEEILLEQLQNRKYDEAGKSLLEYMAAVKSSQSCRAISNCYLLLLSSVTRTLYQAGFTDVLDEDLHAIHDRLTSAEIFDWFTKHIFPLFERVTGTNQIIVNVRQYIHDHIHEDISLAQCAEYMGISASHLSKLFKKEAGINFLDYVLDQKLKNAQELLLSTDLSLRKIAETIGCSERSLIRNFQKVIHMTPNQYRLNKQH